MPTGWPAPTPAGQSAGPWPHASRQPISTLVRERGYCVWRATSWEPGHGPPTRNMHVSASRAETAVSHQPPAGAETLRLSEASKNALRSSIQAYEKVRGARISSW
jgi:hypothetical protein